MRAIHLIAADVQPRHRGQPRDHVVPLSRKAMGAFLRDQMFLAGYFVPHSRLRARRTSSGLPIVGHAASRDRHVDSSGKTHRGLWAWSILADLSTVGISTLQRLANGEHRRTAGFLTVLKVFRALHLQLVATHVEDGNVDLIIQGW